MVWPLAKTYNHLAALLCPACPEPACRRQVSKGALPVVGRRYHTRFRPRNSSWSGLRLSKHIFVSLNVRFRLGCFCSRRLVVFSYKWTQPVGSHVLRQEE